MIPADGWFGRIEPRPGDPASKPSKQPYYIRHADDEPMFLAALTSVMREQDAAVPGAGFVIVTAKADEGLVDVHDRRPLVFSPATAQRWLDPDATPDDLDRLVKSDGVPASHFVWHCVTRDVNRATNDEARLIEPLETLNLAIGISTIVRVAHAARAVVVDADWHQTLAGVALGTRASGAEEIARSWHGDQNKQGGESE